MTQSNLATSHDLLWGALDLTPLQEALLEEHLTKQTLRPGETLWEEGEKSETCMAFLVRGRMKAVKRNEFGSGRIVLGILEPGTVVGLPFSGKNEAKAATLEALEDVELLTMCDAVFAHLLDEHLPLGIHLLHHIHQDFNRKLRAAAERIVRTF